MNFMEGSTMSHDSCVVLAYAQTLTFELGHRDEEQGNRDP